ncbi:MAG: hypothetical protein E7282_05530 [Lachnospiraceae bacterium]|nr:hypothetical protein [Lachnospiraceae bacterium]
MGKASLGIYMEDQEYGKRFCAILMNRYHNKVSLHIYSKLAEILKENQNLDAFLVEGICSEFLEEIQQIQGRNCPVFWLKDSEDTEIENETIGEGMGLTELDKYGNIATTMDEILSHIGREITEIRETGELGKKTALFGIYGLCGSEFQLPFSLTLGEILSETEKVLVLDLQENSGCAEIRNSENHPGLEDLMLLAKTNQMQTEAVRETIGRYGNIDFIYPVENTEILTEADGNLYETMISYIKNYMDYTVILVNFGPRFQGFFDLMNQCSSIYMMQRKGGLGHWRDAEFNEELNRRGYGYLRERLCKIELPIITGSAMSCETLVEQWRWDAFGDDIRKLSMREAVSG